MLNQPHHRFRADPFHHPVRQLGTGLAVALALTLCGAAGIARAQAASSAAEGLRDAKDAIVEAAKKTGTVARQAASATAKVAVDVGKGTARAASGAFHHTKKVGQQVAGEVADKSKQGASAVKDAVTK